MPRKTKQQKEHAQWENIFVKELTVHEKIEAGHYESKLPIVNVVYEHDNKERQKADRKLRSEDTARLFAEFRADLLRENGVTDHPKADLLWSKVYDQYHGYGFSSIANGFEEWVELIKD